MKPKDLLTNAPKRGFALFAGYANHNGQFHVRGGSTVSFSGGGAPNIGLEYQWVVADRLTFALLLVQGGGSLNGQLNAYYDYVGVVELGIELRCWIGRKYIGGHLADYNLAFRDRGDRGSDPLYVMTTSYGALAGYEWDNGWFVRSVLEHGSGNAPSVQVRPDAQSQRVPLGGSVDADSLWISIGYRRK